MLMDIIAGSGKDEYYTPRYAVLPITKYLDPKSTIWCPFDTEDSFFSKELRNQDHEVICTHIWNNQDFFSENTRVECDYIISNHPYSLKLEVFERLFSMYIPFAMLVGVVGLFESRKRFNMFSSNEFEIMYLDKRVSYFKSYTGTKPALNPQCSSAYLTHKILPRQILFETIDKKKF